MKSLHRLPLILLLALPLAAIGKSLRHDPLEIEFSLLKSKAKELPIKSIAETYIKLEKLLAGPEGVIIYKNELYNLEQLVAIEKSLSPQEMRSEQEHLKSALESAIASLQPAIAHFKDSIRKQKNAIKKLISKWAIGGRQIEDRLTPWFDTAEETFIAQRLTTLTTVHNFVDDLAILLIDILHTINPTIAKKLIDAAKKPTQQVDNSNKQKTEQKDEL